MAGIKLSVPNVIFPTSTQDLCIGVCINTYATDLIINIEERINDHFIVLTGCDNITSLVIQKNISEFLSFTNLTYKKISVAIRNIQVAGILEQPSYLSFCLIYALNNYFKQIIEREEFEIYCYEKGLFVKEALCAYHGGILIFNGGKKGYIKVYTADGIYISASRVLENPFINSYTSGDLMSLLLAMDRSDFEQMKSINSLYFSNEADNVLMVIYNSAQNTLYKFTELKDNNATFYSINRIGLEIS
jgi:hypothetical protein